LGINHQAAVGLKDFISGFLYSASVTTDGNKGVGTRAPHAIMFFYMLLHSFPVLLTANIWHWGAVIRTRFQKEPALWLWGLFPLWYCAMLGFSSVVALRYYLPPSQWIMAGAALGLPSLASFIARRPWWKFSRQSAQSSLLALALFILLPRTVFVAWGYTRDDRADLVDWMTAHLPRDAIVAQDELGGLDAPPLKAKLAAGGLEDLKVLSSKYVRDLGSLSELRAQGTTHVLVAWYRSRRFTIDRMQPSEFAREDYRRYRDFYAIFRDDYRPLWSSPLIEPYVLRPGLSLYDIREGISKDKEPLR
jgi:hypothetical protein